MKLSPLLMLLGLAIAGCGGVPGRPDAVPSPSPEAKAPVPPAAPRPGGYYMDDGPGDNPPPDLDAIPDAAPRAEPLHRYANKPYTVLGQDYVPLRQIEPFREQGVASWYGRKFHGRKTSSGEIYDMYAMTAAHPTLPIPSYARVTNVGNGKSVVVRVNDRGPFHSKRVMDLSYAAAYRLGYVTAGSAAVVVESIVPDDAVLAALPRGASAPAAAAQAGDPIAALAAQGAAADRGVFLQLGAFSSTEKAESFRAHLLRQLDWMAEGLRIVAGEGKYRLHLGPYARAEDALQVAERIRDALNLEALLIRP